MERGRGRRQKSIGSNPREGDAKPQAEREKRDKNWEEGPERDLTLRPHQDRTQRPSLSASNKEDNKFSFAEIITVKQQQLTPANAKATVRQGKT